MSFLQKIKLQQEKSNANYKKLLSGEYGLTKTFWLYWFIPTIIFTLIEGYENNTQQAIMLDFAMAVWSTTIAISISKTNNQKLWKKLALLVVVFDVLLSIFAIFTYF